MDNFSSRIKIGAKPPQNSNCFLCNDTGILQQNVYHSFCGLIGERYCSCAAGEHAFRGWCQSEEVQQAIQQKRQQEIENALTFSEIPKKWENRTLDQLEGQEQMKQIINRYLDDFLKLRKQGRGMYLWSTGSGRGKTHVLSAVCQEIINRYAVPSIFMTEERIFLKIRESYDNHNIGEHEQIQRFIRVDCLFIDDFGATRMSPWKAEIITGIVDARLGNALPTFFTSNYGPDDYRTMLSHSLCAARPDRVVSRIYEMCRDFIIEVNGEDWRRKLAIQN